MLAFLNFKGSPKSPNSKHLEDVSRHGRVPDLPMDTDVARVESIISPSQSGRVMFEAVSYPAQCLRKSTYQPGTLVKVLFRKGNTLIVDTLPGAVV